jgi:hypothetical protein
MVRFYRDQGSGIRDQGSGIRDQGSGIRDQGSGIRDQGGGARWLPGREEKPGGRAPAVWEVRSGPWSFAALRMTAKDNGKSKDKQRQEQAKARTKEQKQIPFGDDNQKGPG